MDLFDIVGPIMVGPSSSHTAGAVRMGYVAGKLLGEPICKAEILLYGSFLATGEGHGTKKALVAGLLGMQPDDYQIADSFEIAAQRGITVAFGEAHLEEAHPNTAVIRLTGVGEKYTEVQVSSIGGSRISIDKIDGINTGFSGECPTLIVHNMDQPGCIVAVTSMLAKKNVNIATMQVSRKKKEGTAMMVLTVDSAVDGATLEIVRNLDGISDAQLVRL